MDRTDRMLAEAGRILETLPASEVPRALFDQARRTQDEARRHGAHGRPGLALRLTHQARTLATRALAMAEVAPEPGDVLAMIAVTRDLLAKLDEAVERGAGEDVARLMERSRRLLDEARRDVEAGRVAAALGKVRMGSALALEAATRLDR
jgi:HEPN domain-containing protein